MNMGMEGRNYYIKNEKTQTHEATDGSSKSYV